MSLVLDDTIAALATAPGAAGLAVVRVSGADAVRVAEQVFRGGAALAAAPSHTLHHGWAVWPNGSGNGAGEGRNGAGHAPGARLDEIVVAIFRAPRSYTREDVVELSCHGGDQSTALVLAALYAAGARPARPGEFTLRAFLNGRIDLAQAEAVADLIHASTGRAREIALSQLAGALSERLHEITERIADAAAEVEARVDFAEDVGGVEVPAHVQATIAELSAELGAWLASAPYARAVRDGARVPIVGRPNVGKSSLFNALLGESRAIVAPLPGTTRDRVSESLEIEGIRVVLSDTAGLREAADPIEAQGVSRAEETLASSIAAIWVLDGSEPLRAEDRAIASRLADRRVLAVTNKHDLPRAFSQESLRSLLPDRARLVSASARSGEGVTEVRQALAHLLGAGSREGTEAGAIGNPRHVEALARAKEALERAAAEAREGAPGEIVALELRESLAAAREVTGSAVGEDLLERIFSRFCIGK